MNFQDTQLFGVLIGGGIGFIAAMGAALITQIYTSRRHKKQLAHEREQGNRNRQTGALEDLMTLMEDQATALADLWGFIRDPDRYPFLGKFPEDAWEVLKEKGYRRKIWSTNSQTFKAIAEYARNNSALLSHLQNPNGTSRAKFSDLIFGDVSASDTSSGHLQHFSAATIQRQ